MLNNVICLHNVTNSRQQADSIVYGKYLSILQCFFFHQHCGVHHERPACQLST